ncbi:MAG: 2-hydroxyacyl-CoA dehydratase [Tissierellia bacterium]|nr:2-hydroxyacyl-CoA dehydratase [Tissierellia bacterium]
MRPKTMSKVDELRGANAIAIKEAKEKGEKVVGMYCMFSPQELALAAGARAVSLCGTSNNPIEEAEKVLPRNLCPLIKSSYGFAITDTCPYFFFSDLILAETTCDGKKKMYEEMAKIKPLHLMELPQSSQGEKNLNFWVNEMMEFKAFLEDFYKVEITEENLKDAIKLMNRERDTYKKLHQMNMNKPALLSGVDMLLAQWARGFNVDKEKGLAIIEDLIKELEEMKAKGISPYSEDNPRILVTGTPMGLGSEKLVRLLEDSGASVVALENCTGYKPIDTNVALDKDPLVAIAEKYIKLPCSCMTPNHDRFELVKKLAQDYQVDGIVDLAWQACHTYTIESYGLREYIKDEMELPFLQIETDYSDSDLGQLRTRVEAFLETMVS